MENAIPTPDRSIISYANMACSSCKIRKTKCDKLLPGCAICTSKAWKCNYSEKPKVRKRRLKDSQDPEIPLTKSGYGRHELGGNKFPKSFFLDFSIYTTLRLDMPNAQVDTPPYVKDLLGDTFTIRAIAAQYFKSVHIWMSIISKKLFYVQQLNHMSQPRADVSLLLLCMKLSAWLPGANREDPKTILYCAAKRFHSELEAVGTCSIQMLQSGILIAIYELGNAIYPAAYLSIGGCARYGYAFGFDDSETSGMTQSHDWVQVEERRRAWWAVMILDRCNALGNPKRALATQEPSISSILPIDDRDWDEGILTSGTRYTLGSASNINMGKSARLVQSAHLLGRVLRNATDEILDETFRRQEAVKLQRALYALVCLSEDESTIKELEFCSQISICNSALLILYETHSILMNDFPSQIEERWNTKEAVASHAFKMCTSFLMTADYPIERVAPLVTHFYYQSALIYIQTYHDSRNEAAYESCELLKKGLLELGKKWQCADDYIEMLKAREFIYSL